MREAEQARAEVAGLRRLAEWKKVAKQMAKQLTTKKKRREELKTKVGGLQGELEARTSKLLARNIDL